MEPQDEMFSRSVGFFFYLVCSKFTKDVRDFTKFRISFKFDHVPSSLTVVGKRKFDTADYFENSE